MSAATQAKTAWARSGIAARMLKDAPAYGWSPPRAFDDCFEMNDGPEVVAFLVARAAIDPDLLARLPKGLASPYADLAMIVRDVIRNGRTLAQACARNLPSWSLVTIDADGREWDAGQSSDDEDAARWARETAEHSRASGTPAHAYQYDGSWTVQTVGDRDGPPASGPVRWKTAPRIIARARKTYPRDSLPA